MTTKKLPLSDLDWDDLRLFLQIHRMGSLAPVSYTHLTLPTNREV